MAKNQREKKCDSCLLLNNNYKKELMETDTFSLKRYLTLHFALSFFEYFLQNTKALNKRSLRDKELKLFLQE